MYVPPELVPVNEPPPRDTWFDKWNISEEVRDSKEPYSTFAQGAEPDVWPALEKEEHDVLWSILIVGIAFAIGFIASTLVDRWKMRKIR